MKELKQNVFYFGHKDGERHRESKRGACEEGENIVIGIKFCSTVLQIPLTITHLVSFWIFY